MHHHPHLGFLFSKFSFSFCFSLHSSASAHQRIRMPTHPYANVFACLSSIQHHLDLGFLFSKFSFLFSFGFGFGLQLSMFSHQCVRTPMHPHTNTSIRMHSHHCTHRLQGKSFFFFLDTYLRPPPSTVATICVSTQHVPIPIPLSLHIFFYFSLSFLYTHLRPHAHATHLHVRVHLPRASSEFYLFFWCFSLHPPTQVSFFFSSLHWSASAHNASARQHVNIPYLCPPPSISKLFSFLSLLICLHATHLHACTHTHTHTHIHHPLK